MLLFHLLNLLIYNPLAFVITIAVIIVPLFISITLHEWAHGYVAYKFGDMTPKLQGRLTLNPFAHLDPLGTLMLFTIGIGWAKPVIIDPRNLSGKTQQMLVALAGPASNILLALIFAFVLVYLQTTHHGANSEVFSTITMSLGIIIRINLILAIFNLLPIPPLDGSRVVSWLLPEKLEYYFRSLEPLGLIFILLILFSGGFNYLLAFVDFAQVRLLEWVKMLMAIH